MYSIQLKYQQISTVSNTELLLQDSIQKNSS